MVKWSINRGMKRLMGLIMKGFESDLGRLEKFALEARKARK
jgi:hypothetical protein